MAHKISFFDNADFDQDGICRPTRVEEVETWEAARAMALAHLEETQDPFSISLGPDPELFTSLPAYLEALNFLGRWLAENPQEGAWISILVEDPDHWAESGVRTPRDLAAYLDGCFEREMEKAQY